MGVLRSILVTRSSIVAVKGCLCILSIINTNYRIILIKQLRVYSDSYQCFLVPFQPIKWKLFKADRYRNT